MIRYLISFLLLTIAATPSCADQVEEEILAGYYELLDDAEAGSAQEKLALFSYTFEHSNVLGKYSATALEHLAEASNLGNGEASFRLAQLIEHGMWAEKSAEGALIYYVLAAQQGNTEAMFWCVLHFAEAARDDDNAGRTDALRNTERWYEALSESDKASKDLHVKAKVVHLRPPGKRDPSRSSDSG